MGADAGLIKAAANMAPKAWDYSGIMKGIAALGRYALEKRKVANELTVYGDKQFQIQEIPEEMLSGPFGEENNSFFTNMKEAWSETIKVRQNPLNIPSSKKYKDSVKTTNMLKSSLEKNKADLLVWVEIRKNINENWQNASKAIGRDVFHRTADLQINNTYGEMNASAMFTLNNGIQIFASNDVGTMDGTSYSPSEIMDGFFINQMSLDNNSKTLSNIISKVGEMRTNSGKKWRPDIAKTEINTFVQSMKNAKYGGNGVKSLAFDYYNAMGGGTFVQKNKSMFADPSKSNEDAELSYVEQYKKVYPDASPDEIELAYSHQAADVWTDENSSEYEAKLVDWLVGVAKTSYDRGQTKTDLNKGDTFKLGPLTRSVSNSKVFGPNGIVDRIKAGQEFPVGVLNYKKIDGKWALNDVRGGGKKDKSTGYYFIKDGSNKSLHENLRVVNDERFNFLLK